MIELSQLEEMFGNIAAKSDWNMSGPMLWGYFFTDRSRTKLEALVPVLQQSGCRFVDLFEPELEEGEEPYFFLHVEKEETHSPSSLQERNAAFYALAHRYGIDSYDGMDVGPVAK